MLVNPSSQRRGAAAMLVMAAFALTACGSPTPGATTSTPSGSSGKPRAVTVFAAASLTASFTELARSFEASHSGVTVKLNFGGSSALVTQLTDGAPGDVFASADEKNMAKAEDGGLIQGAPKVFAKNTLTIVTAPGNPKKITDLAALSQPGVSVVVCAPQVPCGSAAEKVEKASGVTLKPVSEEQAVTDVLGKVTSGQADAGLVYVTDAKSAGAKVASVPFAEADKAVNTYPIAALKSATDAALADEFVGYVSGPTGRAVLTKAGFAAP